MSVALILVTGTAAAIAAYIRSRFFAPTLKFPNKEKWITKKGYAGTYYHDTLYPPFMNPTTLDVVRSKCHFRPSDIVIATYPKCGTTLTQQIVLTLLADGEKELVKEPMALSKWIELEVCKEGPTTSHDAIAAFEAWQPDPATQRKPPARRVIKTHAPSHLAPWIGGANGIPEHGKVVIITRNPADACVSMWNHARDIPSFEYSELFEHFLSELYLQGKVESGDFWRWHAGWWETYGANLDRCLWISFDDYKIDPHGVISKIAKFIDCGASEECIARTVESASFGNMRANADQTDKEKAMRGEKFKKNHIRQGLSGAWRKVFTGEQEKVMMEQHEMRCKEFGMPLELFNFN